MKTVILCGGKGTRMGNDDLPKGLFPIGGRPILWHIMSIYSHYGFNDFILCLGYKGKNIREYFEKVKQWKITFVETGENTNTGGRLKKIEEHINEDHFLATYGDGLADINLSKLVNFHRKHKKSATITVVKPFSQFGIVGVDPHTQSITHFEEKPILDHWINGGFFVFNRNIFGYLKGNDILEKDSFKRLLIDKKLNAFKHLGFWRCMDTYKDNLELNELWKERKAAWKIWEE
ncbi:MAG: sugar phosphate nucleotidyltransferase [Candidatus Omnitrophica bacterium]|nr:sugar phosphate nucleotidyltransferase [Candidatus Omnitrophota bacterium]MDD5660371.1 sugar phosphate nucleotidyltransferase [Candidatus Omnitrophota bacterium]